MILSDDEEDLDTDYGAESKNYTLSDYEISSTSACMGCDSAAAYGLTRGKFSEEGKGGAGSSMIVCCDNK